MLPDYKLKRNLIMIPRRTLSFVGGDYSVSYRIYGRGFIVRMLVEVPTHGTKTMTTDVTITNTDGVAIYVSSACAESTTTIIAPDPPVPIVEWVLVTVAADQNPAEAFTNYISIYLDGDK